MKKKLNMFIPLTKVDVEQRLVYGVATAEKPDRSGEVCDYAASKPNYEKWSNDISKATGGKSLGNLRVMHGKIAAGKLTDIHFNDEAQQIEICAKVVDDAEWKKVQEGVYTGFSHGGSYGKIWKGANGETRYEALPIEVSLVDIPALPEATFTMVHMAKDASGTAVAKEDVMKFSKTLTDPSLTEIGNRAEEMAKAAGEGKTWNEFVEAAHNDLLMKQLDGELEKVFKKDGEEAPEDKDEEEEEGEDAEDDADEEAPENKKKDEGKKKKVKKYVEPKQLWRCNCPEHEHLNKSAAIKCMKEEEASDNAAAAAAPVAGALAKLAKALKSKGATPGALELIKSWTPEVVFDDAQVSLIVDHVTADEALAKSIGEIDLTKGIADVMTKLQAATKEAPLVKSLYSISRFADALSYLRGLHSDATFEAQYSELYDAEVCVKIKEGMKTLIEALKMMVETECAMIFPEDAEVKTEMVAGLTLPQVDALIKDGGEAITKHGDALRKFVTEESDLEKIATGFEKTRDALPEEAKGARDLLDKCVAKARDLAKAGARHSKQDVEMLQTMHDMSVELGALCGSGDDAEKSVSGGDLAKTENAELRKQLADLVPAIDTLTKQVQELRAQPMPPKAVTRTVTKVNDVGANEADDATVAMAKHLEALSPEERNKELMKLALKSGLPGHPAHSGH